MFRDDYLFHFYRKNIQYMFDMCCYKTKFSLFIMCRVYLLFLFSSSLMFILLAHTPGGNLLSPVFDDVKKTLIVGKIIHLTYN